MKFTDKLCPKDTTDRHMCGDWCPLCKYLPKSKRIDRGITCIDGGGFMIYCGCEPIFIECNITFVGE